MIFSKPLLPICGAETESTVKILKPNPRELHLEDIPEFLAGLLTHLPMIGASSEDDAEARLYPAPSRDPDMEELVSDWNAHVQPGLQELFQSSRDVVAADLRQLERGGENPALIIPLKHADAWLNALNQARIVIACEQGFGEDDLGRPPKMPPSSPRDVARFQMDFYALLQEALLEATET